MRARFSALLGLVLVGCSPPTSGSFEPPPVEPPPPFEPLVGPADVAYTVSFVDAERNRLRVTARAQQGCGSWWMATWIQGSYLVREFARNVESVEARGASGPLPVRKTAKDTWLVACEGTGEGQPVALSYTVAARELTVRTSYVDDAGAVLNPPSWAIVPEASGGPFSVGFADVPWPSVHVPLPEHDGAFVADDVDALMDAPMLLGTSSVQRFEVDGIPHTVATLDPEGLWTHPRIADDVKAIVEAQRDFWRGLPYREYHVLNALGARGGLEHDDSTLLLALDFSARMDADGEPLDGDAYRRWLSVVSHEVFHAWNVRRLRPAGLLPNDHRREQYTPDLWVAEGLTSYYDNLLLARAGRMTEEQLLAAISKEVKAVVQTPGRTVQPLSQASMDAWIEFYRHDEHSVNQGISYYRKGALVGLILDVAIRRNTNEQHTLDDAMRRAYARYGADPAGYPPEGFRAVLSETAGTDLGPLLHRLIDTTEELPLDDALAYFGLMRTPIDPEGLPPHHGADLSVANGQVTVSTVLRGTPAWKAGVMPGDELLAVDGWRLHDTGRLDALVVGPHTWTVVRRGRLQEVLVVTEAASPEAWEVVVDPTASLTAQRYRRGWLGSER